MSTRTETDEVPTTAPASVPAGVPREIELKLAVAATAAPAFWAEALGDAVPLGNVRVARLDNRYFDTADRALAQAGLALRLRRSGRQWLQTLKAAGPSDGALSARGEWEMPVAGPALELGRLRDTPLAALGSPRVLARRLLPVFTTNFRREARELKLHDGTIVECAFDVGTIVAGRGKARRTLPIAELEIELRSAGESDGIDAVLRFAERASAHVALTPLAAGKAARGHRLAEDRALEPAKAELPAVAPGTSAVRHLAAVLEACQAALLANAHALVELAADGAPLDVRVEFVHQARVAIRRARSALFTFRRVTKGDRVTRVDEALRTIGHRFGDVRDLDVFADGASERIADKVASGPEMAAILQALRTAIAARREQAHRALIATLQERAFGSAMIAVARLVRRFDREADGPGLGARVPDWLERQRERVIERARRIAELDIAQRHVLRIEVKRLRYALDLFENLFDVASTGRFRDALADLQGKLGRLQDDVVARELLTSLPQDAQRDALVASYDAWFERHLFKQLPKVAALSVEFELTPTPWRLQPARATAPASDA